ncbi:MAG TPA: hypothetical protein VME45_11680 [Stellaceae bacterium]|nr:hypothetical protein [Stellaceae bacterium]
MQTISFLLARFSEPSSYAGLGALLALAGLNFSDTDLGQLAQFLAAGCGLAALLLKERGMIQMIALAVLLGASLGACSAPGPQAANPGSTTSQPPSPTQIIAAGQSAAQTLGAVMTDAEAGMCQVQSIANLTAAIAGVAGSGTVQTDAQKASEAAGLGCTWTTASATPSVTPTATTAAPATAPAAATSP